MIRESEAKRKWCPFGRQLVTLEREEGLRKNPIHATSANRFIDEYTGTLCWGSGCMAWRSPNGSFGYCGLVGKEDS